jgi:hypothetical protein
VNKGDGVTNRLRLGLAAALLALPACGPKATDSGVRASLGAHPLDEVGEVYKYIAAERKPPPAKLADLEAYEPSLPTAWPKLQSGELVVYWGSGAGKGADATRTVLGYEKDVPASGGKVLMQDGSVKAMTAGEFQSAPKAKR